MSQKKQVTLTSLFGLKKQASEEDRAPSSPPKQTSILSSSSLKPFASDPHGSSLSKSISPLTSKPVASSATPAVIGSDDSESLIKAPVRRRLVVSDDELQDEPAPKKIAPTPTPAKATSASKPANAVAAAKRSSSKRSVPDDREEEEEEEEDSDDERETSPKTKKKTKPAAAATTAASPAKRRGGAAMPMSPSGGKFTPLQMQVLQVKANNPDTLLLVECGYKYRFFGEDAEIASKVLGIHCGEDHGMASAMIPTFRLHYHLARLVNAGHKVGVVTQTETAAVKKMTKERGSSKTFARELTGLYTKSTLIESEFYAAEDAGRLAGSNTYLLCINEVAAGGESGAAARVQLCAVAVQASTGDVYFDCWIDDLLRGGLETIFLQLPPSELILPTTPLSPPTERVLEMLARRTDVRVERIDDAHFQRKDAAARLSKFYKDKLSALELAHLLDELGEGPQGCLAAMTEYLAKFRLDSILLATASFSPARLKLRMSLPASTLTNLELFTVTSTGGERGSLFSIINATRTLFGRRMLRKWLGAPLTNRSEIITRQEAVEELLRAKSPTLSLMAEHLRTLPDLERGICRAYYRKIGSQEFLNLLLAFEKLAELAEKIKTDKSISCSLLRTDLFADFAELKRVTASFLRVLNQEACQRNDKKEMLQTSQFPALHAQQQKIDEVRERLAEHLEEIRKKLKKPDLEYVFKQGQADYMIEVSSNEEGKVPSNWTKVSSTKTLVRFHSPTIIECLDELALYSEQLQIEAQVAWNDLLSKFEADYISFRNATAKLATFDCLLSLAAVAKERGYTKPIITDERRLRIRQGRNAVVEASLQERGEAFIPNDTPLDAAKTRAMLITGPNMGGKSCYIRQVAQIAILAQIGSFVPAEECELSPFDAVFTRMGASDNLEKGRSTFFVELLETSQVLSQATERSLVIMDELGRGTSTFDGTAIAFATLFHLVSVIQSFTLFVTHYPVLGQLERLFPVAVANYNMNFVPEASANNSSSSSAQLVTFLYRLVRGVAPSSFGLNVAHMAGMPEEVIVVAKTKSEEMKNEMEHQAVRGQLLASLLEPSSYTIENLLKLQSMANAYLKERSANDK